VAVAVGEETCSLLRSIRNLLRILQTFISHLRTRRKEVTVAGSLLLKIHHFTHPLMVNKTLRETVQGFIRIRATTAAALVREGIHIIGIQVGILLTGIAKGIGRLMIRGMKGMVVEGTIRAISRMKGRRIMIRVIQNKKRND
jgi:hypothetical protein